MDTICTVPPTVAHHPRPCCIRLVHHEQAVSVWCNLLYLYISIIFLFRYYNEFKEIGCLGKGGYGIVFEVQNNIDHGHYAMKRITLNRQ